MIDTIDNRYIVYLSTLPALRVPDVHVVAGDHHWAAGAGAAGEGAGQREVARGVLKKHRGSIYHLLLLLSI